MNPKFHCLLLTNSSTFYRTCECRSLRFNWYSFLDRTLPPALVASGWKVWEELPAWTPAGANSVFFKLTGMQDWRFSLWVTSKAIRGKRVNSLELIRFKSSLSWYVSFFGIFISAFVLFQLSRWRMYASFLHLTHVQIKIYIFISTRLMSMIFGPSCCS